MTSFEYCKMCNFLVWILVKCAHHHRPRLRKSCKLCGMTSFECCEMHPLSPLLSCNSWITAWSIPLLVTYIQVFPERYKNQSFRLLPSFFFYRHVHSVICPPSTVLSAADPVTVHLQSSTLTLAMSPWSCDLFSTCTDSDHYLRRSWRSMMTFPGFR